MAEQCFYRVKYLDTRTRKNEVEMCDGEEGQEGLQTLEEWIAIKRRHWAITSIEKVSIEEHERELKARPQPSRDQLKNQLEKMIGRKSVQCGNGMVNIEGVLSSLHDGRYCVKTPDSNGYITFGMGNVVSILGADDTPEECPFPAIELKGEEEILE